MSQEQDAAPARDATEVLDGVRWHVVTGKGGTGKTTVATALALALAGEGRRVLLCEVEGRQGVARLLDVEELPPRETEVAEGDGGGQVVVLSVEARTALLLYLETFYRLGRAGAALDKVGAVDFITAVAPGLRDILLVGMVYETVRRTRKDGRPAYDAVVLDAPPTGRVTKFLGIGEELATLAGGGPIAGQAASVAALLRSPLTAVHLVTLLEDLPVQESVEAAAELVEAGLPLGLVVANRVLSAPAGTADADAHGVGRDLEAAGLPADLAGPLLEQGRTRAGAAAGQRRHLATLAGIGAPVLHLPERAGTGHADLYALADALREVLPASATGHLRDEEAAS